VQISDKVMANWSNISDQKNFLALGGWINCNITLMCYKRLYNACAGLGLDPKKPRKSESKKWGENRARVRLKPKCPAKCPAKMTWSYVDKNL